MTKSRTDPLHGNAGGFGLLDAAWRAERPGNWAMSRAAGVPTARPAPSAWDATRTPPSKRPPRRSMSALRRSGYLGPWSTPYLATGPRNPQQAHDVAYFIGPAALRLQDFGSRRGGLRKKRRPSWVRGCQRIRRRLRISARNVHDPEMRAGTPGLSGEHDHPAVWRPCRPFVHVARR